MKRNGWSAATAVLALGLGMSATSASAFAEETAVPDTAATEATNAPRPRPRVAAPT